MDLKALKVISAVFIALTIVMAGLFVFEYSGLNSERTSYNGLQTSYDTQQGSVILKNAYAHWDYIAIENSSLLQTQYTDNATLHWMGGPLTGTYTGVNNITSTWNKFFGLWSAVWYYTVTPPAVTVNGNTATVISSNQFILTPVANQTQTQYLNISYTLDYMVNGGNWSIYSETWHIVGAGFVSASEQFVNSNYIESLAFSHWNNIAIENNTTVMQEYEPNATLHWVGGPLNGTYSGLSEINTTWNRFFGLWSAVWFYAESPPVITISGNTANVNATVQFIVQNAANTSQFKYINVSYDIMYFNNGFSAKSGMPQYMIYNEVFHITGSNTVNKL
ncbi:MAG: nuclear transport factor 2-like protein [Thermoplasmataceae archaeon]